MEGIVVAIADGDTITLLDATKTQHKVRLAGIDAPEKKQAFDNVSWQWLGGLVFQRTVTVEYTKSDRYGRLIGKVSVADRDANLAQVTAGMAWHYKKYAKEQRLADRVSYAEAEHDARTAHHGLWQDAPSIPHWDFRERARHSQGGS